LTLILNFLILSIRNDNESQNPLLERVNPMIGHEKSIKVCQGPGCKSWGSKNVLRTLKCHFRSHPEEMGQVGTSPCMNRCGGGAAVQIDDSPDEVIKVRKPGDLIRKLLGLA